MIFSCGNSSFHTILKFIIFNIRSNSLALIPSILHEKNTVFGMTVDLLRMYFGIKSIKKESN